MTDDWIFLSPPDVGVEERNALLRAFDSGWVAPVGPELDAFEAEIVDFVGAEACVALNSASSAIHLGLVAVGVKPGDDVVVQTSTFAASAFAVAHAGANPVFCGIDPQTWCMEPNALEGLLTDGAAAGKLPTAVVTVDLYGYCPDYAAITEICGRFGVPIVEDSAEALGSISDGKFAGTFGDIGVFSFNGNKIITTSGGGALVGSKESVDHVRYLATQAKLPFMHYEHEDIGFNFRMSNLLAAVGRAQLASLPGKIERCLEINAQYRKMLPMLEWPDVPGTERPNGWLSVALLPDGLDPTGVCERAKIDFVECRPTWKPMHMQPVFDGARYVGSAAAEEIFNSGICLPSGSGMSDEQLDRAIAAVTSAVTPAIA